METQVPNTTKKSRSLRNYTKQQWAATIIVTLVTMLIVRSFLGWAFPIKNNQISNSDIAAVMDESNKNLPMMVDEETRLDSIESPSDKTIKYNYTLINLSKDELDLEEFRSLASPELLNYVKNTPGMEGLRENQIFFVYSYDDKNGEFLLDVNITPDQYK